MKIDPLIALLANDEQLAHLYEGYAGLLIEQLDTIGRRGIILDLDSLPSEPYPLKKLFLMWLMSVNRERINRLQQPIVTYDLVMKCPLWKVVSPPFRPLKLETGALNNASAFKTVRQRTDPKGINKSRS